MDDNSQFRPKFMFDDNKDSSNSSLCLAQNHHLFTKKNKINIFSA